MNSLSPNPASTPDQARAFLTAAIEELGDSSTGKTLTTTLASLELGDPAVYLGRLGLIDDRYTRPLFTVLADEVGLFEDFRGSEVYPFDSLTHVVRSAIGDRNSGSRWKHESAKVIRDVMLSAFNGAIAIRLNTLRTIEPQDFAHVFHVLDAMFIGSEHGSLMPRIRRRRIFDADIRNTFIALGGEAFFFAPLYSR